MNDSIGISLKTLLQVTYQELQVRYEEQRNVTQERSDSVQLFLDIKNVSGFLKKGSVYMISGCTPVKNREMILEITYSIIKNNEADTKALIFLMKTDAQDWMLQMLSRYSDIPMSRLQSGVFYTDDWRLLAAATGQMASADIRVVSVADESELFRDAGDFLREGNVYNHIFIDSVDIGAGTLDKLKEMALDFDVPLIASSRAFDGLKFPEINAIV